MATSTSNAALTLTITGAASVPPVPLKRGEKTTVAAKAGQRYRVVKEGEEADKAADKQSDKQAATEAAKDVAASQHGQDLLLSYADGTQVVLSNFYEACKAGQCAVDMPGSAGSGASGGYVITGDSPVGAGLSNGGRLVYAFGDTSALAGMTQGAAQASGFTLGDSFSTYIPAHDAHGAWNPMLAVLGGVGATAALLQGSKAEPVPTVIHGSVVAGPVVAGNGLTAVAYKADGTVLATGTVNADGTFTLNVGNDYRGPVLVKISDTNAESDYWDEASNAPKDLSSDLRALALIPSAGSYNVSVNLLTELAVRSLGLTGGDTGGSTVNFANVSDTQIVQANQKVAAAVGLTQDLVLGAPPVAIITTEGVSNTQTNDYGRLLAALSGAEVGSTTSAVLDDLADKLQSSQAQATGQVLERLLEGAAKVNLVAAISDITNQKSTAITISAVSQDNRLSPAEMVAGVQVEGTAEAGASVTITWSDASGTATATGTRTVTADTQGQWSTSFNSAEMPALGATTLKASVGASAATRSIYLDAPLAPTIALTQTTGNVANLTRNGHVEVSGVLPGAGWDYSLDNGATWAPGSGSGFTATGDGAKHVLVRQNIGGHCSPASNSLDFELDATAPSITSGNTAAVDESASANPVIYTALASDPRVLSYSLKATGDHSLLSINAATGAVTLTGNPDHETKSSYNFTVIATDAAGNASEKAVTLAINNRDEVAPAISSGAVANAIDENSGAGQTIYTATSTDTGDVATGSTTYSLKATGDQSLLSINSATGAVTLTANPDFETKPSYIFTVVATDAAGNASEQAVTLAINNRDEAAPAITSGAVANAIDENSGAGQLIYTATSTDTGDVATGSTTYSLKATGDQSLLSINSATGAVTLAGSPDYETQSSYNFTVIATDAAGNASEQAVTLAINNLDEVAPAITSGASANAIDENSGAAQVIYTATSTDTGDVATGSTTYSLKASGDHSLLSINSTTGAVILTGNPDHETQSSYNFTVIATDMAGNASEKPVTLAINNRDEAAPAISSGAVANAINENSGAAQLIYTATSTDTGDVATGSTTYSLNATGDQSLLSINAATGAVTLTGNPDHETQSSYNFTVIATDAVGNASEQAVTLGVNDLDEVAPTVSISASATSLGADATATLTFTLSEAVASFSDASVTVTGGTLSNFAGSGTLYTATFTPDAGLSGAASINVAAAAVTDLAGNSSSAASNTVSITVDTLAPQVASISASRTSLLVDQTATLSISLSEASTTFGLADLQAVGGTLSNLAGSGVSYTATFTPDDNRADPGSVSVTARSFSDAAGNDSRTTDNDGVILAISTVRPTAELLPRLSRLDRLGMGDATTIDITLSEKSSNFVVGDLTAHNGTLSEFTTQGDGIHYSVLFTPNAPYTGFGDVALAEGVFTNAAGNSSAASQSNRFIIDTTPPTVTITSDVTALTIGQSAKVTFTFNKDPGDSFDATDITVNGGTLTNLVNNTGTIWTARFTPTDGSTGEASITVASGRYTDAAGNKGAAGTTPAITIDTQGPAADSLLPGNATTVLPGHALVLGFNEVVHKGTGNIVLVNDTAGTRTTLAVSDASVVLSGDGKTLTLTPATALVAGSQYHVEADPASLLDTAGNAWAGIAASSTWAGSNWRFTAATPSVSLNKITADNLVNGAENTAGVLISGVLESETLAVVQAFQAGDFTITLTQGSTTIPVTVTNYDSTSGVGVWSGTVASASFTQNGTYSVNVTASRVISSSTVSATTTGSVLVDLSVAAPTLALIKDTGSSNSDAVTSNAIVSVSGLEAGAAWEYKIDSGSWTTGSGNQFTGASTAAAHTVQVRQTDAAGNVSSNGSFSFTLDTTAAKPVINAIATDNIINAGEIGSTITGTAEANASLKLAFGSGDLARTVSVTADGSGVWTHTLDAADMAGLSVATSGLTQITATQTDVAGNTSYTAQRNLTVDTAAPTVSIYAATPRIVAGNPSTELSFTLSESSSDFNAAHVTVTGGTLSNFAGSGKDYSATFTPTSATTTAGSVRVAAGAFQDAAGNANAQASNTIELFIDTVRPTVAVTSNLSTLEAGKEAIITFTLSEASNTFNDQSILVTGGSLGQLSANAAGTVYTAVYTPNQGYSGAGSVRVASSVFYDEANNENADGTDTDNTVALTIQNEPITLAISSNKAELKVGETATLSFDFSSVPTGFAAADITVTGGTLGALTTVDSTHYTATFTPTASAASGTASVSVTAGAYTSAGGKAGEGAKVSEITFDTLAPTLSTLNPEDNGYLAVGNALVATFTEAVSAGTGSIRLVDDTASSTITYAITDSAIVIDGDTLTLTPNTALVSGHNYHLNIDSTALVDAAGNAYVGIANATSWNFGATNLSTTLNPVTGDSRINADEDAAGPVVFSGTVSSANDAVLGGLLASDIVVKVTVPRNGGWNDGTDKIITCTGVTYDSTTGKWTATLPENWVYDGFTSNTTTSTLINGDTDTIRVTITGRSGTAAAGLSATLSDTMTVDLSNPAQPTLTLASDTGSSTSDGITRNGLINVGALEAGGSWQYSLDNGDNWQTGTGSSLAIPQDGVFGVKVKQADAAGNESAERSLAVTLDTQISAPVVNAIATDNRINASEATSAITGTADANARVELVIGANTRTVTANSSGVWSYTLVAADLTAIGQGNEVISVTQTDKAGNTSAATSAVMDVDTARPTVTLANTGSASLLAGQSTTVTATLSELVANFSASNFTVSGGALSELKADSAGLVYTGTFTPDADSTTAGSIQVAAGAVTDAAGNTNAAASAALALTINTVRPTVAVTSNVSAGTTLHAGDTATVTFTLSASSSDFTAADLTVTGGTLSNWTAVSGTSYTATYTPDANSKAPGSVSVASATFANAAANTNADGADANNSVTFAIATTRPSLSISSDQGTLGGGQTAVISFQFSEDPGTSFVVGDISTTDSANNVTGTLSEFKGQGTSYTALFTPTAGFAGAASITVANGAYTNADGSLGQTGTTPVLTIDAVAPTVAITQSATSTLGAGGTDTITFDFSEAPGESFTLADVDVSGGTLGALSAVSETRYVATFTPQANAAGTAKISVASARFADAAGNTNADGSDTNNALAISYATAVVSAGTVTATDVPTLALHQDTGASTTDHITTNGVIDVGGLVAGATWQYSLDGGSNWLTGSGASFNLPSAAIYSALQVRQTDGVTTSNVGSLSGDAVDYRTEYLGNLSLALARDSGSSGTDGITYNGKVIVSGSSYGVWQFSVDNGLTWGYGEGSDLPHSYMNVEAGTEKQVTVLVKSTDEAGNTAEKKISFTLDLENPAAPNVTLTTDPSDGGAIVAATNVEPGGSVKYMLNSGDLTSTYTPPTAPGNYTLKVVSYDVAGNGAQTNLSFTVAAAGGGPIELSAVASGNGGFVINGECRSDSSGWSISAAGDVNGDGLADVIVGANYSDPAAMADAGRSYVVFGTTSNAAIDLTAVTGGTGGFVISGEADFDHSGISVSAAGDVNGDGLADVIVGAKYSDPAAMDNAGRSYVVFGKTSSAAIDLSAVTGGTGGFVISGEAEFDRSGTSVSAAGDVNGDGLADMIVGAKDGGIVKMGFEGRSYVVFGKTSSAAIDLATVTGGTGGFVINGQAGDQSGISVSAAGDVNGDGFADVIVGAWGANNSGGRSYVVFGKTSSAAIDLSTVPGGTSGFVINGQAVNDQSGISVSAAGDVNGDGLADLIVGANYSDPAAGIGAGRSYVVFGKTAGTTINLADVASGVGGFVINGEYGEVVLIYGQLTSPGDQSGFSVSSAGDINGDGLADLIVGAPNSDPAAGSDAGRSYILFGKTTGSGIDLSAVAAGSGGFVINGAIQSGGSGTSVSSAGDVNGDGLADLVVGAPRVNFSAGRSYVIFGNTTGAFAQTAVDWMGTDADDTMTDGNVSKTLVGGAGNDSLTATAASVLYGGAGNDRLIINNVMGNALELAMGQGNNVDNLSRIDGGSGIDTLVLLGGGMTLDLTKVANQAGANPDGGSRIDSVEVIDLTGTGNNTLVLAARDVQDMAGMNLFNSGNGWTGLAPSVARHQVRVDGNAGDVLSLGSEWGRGGTASYGGVTYSVYNAGSGAQLLINAAVSIKLPPIYLADIAAGVGGFVINGDSASSKYSGRSVSAAGDVNGDGLIDLIVGAADANSLGGRSYVVFGKTSGAATDLTAVASGTGGFVINGQAVNDPSGISVSAAGDVNGDGLADLIVGAYGANSFGGRSYVVFGKTSGDAMDLAAVASGTGGFVINGDSASSRLSGFSVSAAGDVNGDGLADLIVGAYGANANGGRSYVVFGKTSSAAMDLAAVAGGTGGFVINGQAVNDQSGISVSAAGDVNGDGLADLIVGAYEANSSGGRSYVVFGKTTGTGMDLSAVAGGTGGFVINGDSTSTFSGYSVSSAGDVNGDGLADLIVGAYGANRNRGGSYVVFGKTSGAAMDLMAVASGTGGFVIQGQAALDQSGISVSAAGDVNGDGLADLIVGADIANNTGGRSYVIFGNTSGAFGQTMVNWMGTDGADTQSDGGAAQTLVAGAGNDSLIATAASVLYGGAGNDTFTINSTMLTALQRPMGSGGNLDRLARIDGGSGVDTLALSGAGLTFDLKQVANQAAGNPDGGSRIDSIERIDLTGSGNNLLRVTAQDVQALAGMNWLNSTNASSLGWAPAAGTTWVSVARHQLVVDGNTGDELVLGSGWTALVGTFSNTLNNTTNTYTVYNKDAAQLLVDTDVTVLRPLPIALSAVAAGIGGFVINGQGANDLSGYSVSAAGDVNGDGLADFIIGAQKSDPASLADAGRSYVVFGKTGTVAVNLSDVAAVGSTVGFVINGQAASDLSGFSVSGAGDVNGDGFADLLVGAYQSDPTTGANAGRSYVVFGKASGAAVNLSAIAASTGASGGFVIIGQTTNDNSGWTVSAAGDVNGDGYADVMVGAKAATVPDADALGTGNQAGAGRAYVIFGKSDAAAVQLSAVAQGTGGFVVNGRFANDYLGTALAGGGDINGDGLDDLVIGASGADSVMAANGTFSSSGWDGGQAFVVFGKTSTTKVNTMNIAATAGSADGFLINGLTKGDASGASVSIIGDVNGDGLLDIAVGAKGSDFGGTSAGRAFVVFGKTDNAAVQLSAVAAGDGGFAINGAAAGDETGYSVSSAGDINGDGLADLIVGAHLADPTGASNGGRSYVVFGQTGTGAINLSAVAAGMGGFVVNGQGANDESGLSVSAAGDVDGDGLMDLLVGAPNSDPNSLSNAGRSYIIFGSNNGIRALSKVDQMGSTGVDSLTDNGVAQTLVAGAGNDSLTATAASVLYGGSGDDRFVLNQAMLTGLQSAMGQGGNAADRLARAAGGDGLDTLALSGSGQALNLAQIDAGRIDSMEVIDLTGSGDNVFSPTASASGVLSMARSNVYNSGNGWTGLAAQVNSQQLRVEGNAGDLINLTANWSAGSQATYGGQTYNTYQLGLAQLLVNTAVTMQLDSVPTVSNVALTATTGANGAWLVAGSTVTATVTLSEAVQINTAGGRPTLALDIGGTTVQAAYAGASGNQISFTTTIAAGQAADGGIALPADGLALNGAVISDTTGNVASQFTYTAVSANSSYKVDTLAATPNAIATNGLLAAPTNAEAGATVEYRSKQMGGTFSTWSSTFAQPAADGTADGRYLVELRQTDVAGNVSASQSVTLDVGHFYLPIALSDIGTGLGGFVINGENIGPNKSGYSVSGAGDVNGDGLADLIVGAPYANSSTGRSYVVFGQSTGTAINLTAVDGGTGGFVIRGPGGYAESGSSVSAAGDVNGDGLADLIVGSPKKDSSDGRSYVVFGKASSGAIELGSIDYGSSTGFAIIGRELTGDQLGTSVSAAGDVNGDGLADLIVGAPQPSTQQSGRSYVVFGKSTTSAVNLETMVDSVGGFLINRTGLGSKQSGFSVSAAGDVNGDGLADLIVGAVNASGDLSYVVFGQSRNTVIDLTAVMSNRGGFAINGQNANNNSGYSVSAAGDVNGDGLADLVVGEAFVSSDRGRSYVVFGKNSGGAIELGAVAGGTGGFVINGQDVGEMSGSSVSVAGDVNGDGLADLIVGAPGANSNLGRSYVVFGKSTGAAIDLSAVAAGSGGFVINGDVNTSTSGTSVSAAGDVNGDGLADLIVGAPLANSGVGRSFVIFGGTSGAFNQTAVDQLGGAGNDSLTDNGNAQTLVAGAGNDTLTATAASVLYGGSGDDRFTIDSSMVTALQSAMGSGGNTTQLARIDGGSGIDTVVLSGGGLTFDLTQVANQAASNPDGGSRIDSIEKIELTGSGDNTLKLNLFDVLDLGSANLFQATGRQQLLVKGDAGDTVNLADGTGTTGWTAGSAAIIDTVSYAVWNHDTSLATVYVQTGVVVV